MSRRYTFNDPGVPSDQICIGDPDYTTEISYEDPLTLPAEEICYASLIFKTKPSKNKPPKHNIFKQSKKVIIPASKTTSISSAGTPPPLPQRDLTAQHSLDHSSTPAAANGNTTTPAEAEAGGSKEDFDGDSSVQSYRPSLRRKSLRPACEVMIQTEKPQPDIQERNRYLMGLLITFCVTILNAVIVAAAKPGMPVCPVLTTLPPPTQKPVTAAPQKPDRRTTTTTTTTTTTKPTPPPPQCRTMGKETEESCFYQYLQYRTCAKLQETPNIDSRYNGRYLLFTDRDPPGCIPAYCDMNTHGGGWTIFQKREEGSVSFNRSWEKYRDGFGDVCGEFWLGNHYLNEMTENSDGPYTLRIEMESFRRNNYWVEYQNFSIGNESENYKLKVGKSRKDSNYISMGMFSQQQAKHECFKSEDGLMFSTFDNGANTNCSVKRNAGWWWSDSEKCSLCSLNNMYKSYPQYDPQYIIWFPFKREESLRKTQMMFRPSKMDAVEDWENNQHGGKDNEDGDNNYGGGRDHYEDNDYDEYGGDNNKGGGDTNDGGGDNYYGGGDNHFGGGDNYYGGGDNNFGGGDNNFGGGDNNYGGGDNINGGGGNNINEGGDNINVGKDDYNYNNKLDTSKENQTVGTTPGLSNGDPENKSVGDNKNDGSDYDDDNEDLNYNYNNGVDDYNNDDSEKKSKEGSDVDDYGGEYKVDDDYGGEYKVDDDYGAEDKVDNDDDYPDNSYVGDEANYEDGKGMKNNKRRDFDKNRLGNDINKNRGLEKSDANKNKDIQGKPRRQSGELRKEENMAPGDPGKVADMDDSYNFDDYDDYDEDERKSKVDERKEGDKAEHDNIEYGDYGDESKVDEMKEGGKADYENVEYGDYPDQALYADKIKQN